MFAAVGAPDERRVESDEQDLLKVAQLCQRATKLCQTLRQLWLRPAPRLCAPAAMQLGREAANRLAEVFAMLSVRGTHERDPGAEGSTHGMRTRAHGRPRDTPTHMPAQHAHQDPRPTAPTSHLAQTF